MLWLCEKGILFEYFLTRGVWGAKGPQNMFMLTGTGLENTGLVDGLFLGQQSAISAFFVTLETPFDLS